MPVNTLNKRRLLEDLKDPEFRRLFYAEHIHNALPFQIRELRKKRKFTQKQLAALVGKHQKNLSDWENPNYEYMPQIGTLISLADAFDVPLIVRFGSWEELWDWEQGISPEKLAPRKFEDALPDLKKKAGKAPKSEASAGRLRVIQGEGDDTPAPRQRPLFLVGVERTANQTIENFTGAREPVAESNETRVARQHPLAMAAAGGRQR